MTHAQFRFYEELNDFLPPPKRKVIFTHEWRGTASVKDLVESLGVPHTEVDLILVNGESVDFSYRPSDGDRISVYPMFESLDIAPVQRLRPRPLREPRFVLDGHLGRLAAYRACWASTRCGAAISTTRRSCNFRGRKSGRCSPTTRGCSSGKR